MLHVCVKIIDSKYLDLDYIINGFNMVAPNWEQPIIRGPKC